jgi:hypothetical protein
MNRAKGKNAGFILPITLGLISLVGLWGTILIEQMHRQSDQLAKSWQEKFIFYKAQEHLGQCLGIVGLQDLPTQRWGQCCHVEEMTHPTSTKTGPKVGTKSSKLALQKSYRVSVHHELIHPISHQILGSSRLQAVVTLSPTNQAISKLSWREIFDLHWEQELNALQPKTNYIWGQLPACKHPLPTN